MQDVQFTQDADGISVNIAVNEQFNGLLIESISMFVGTTDDGDGYFGDGDLAVNYSIEGLTNNADADTMGSLLMRNIHSEDEVTAAMGMFYWDSAYTARLREILIAHGFSADAANGVSGSEWGMQDEGRASYDAYSIADEVRKHFNIAVAA